MEGGKGEAKVAAKGGGKKPAVFPMSPRASADPLQTHDPWTRAGNRAAGLGFVPDEHEPDAAWAGYTNTASSPKPAQYTMPARPGDRTGLIFGGFKADTDRAHIEECLRKIMLHVDGVEEIQALGKFAIAGKVTSTDNNMMWTFIKANTKVKFQHGDDARAVWLSIEKTQEERRGAGRISGIVKGLVNHLTEIGGLDPVTAKRHIDSDYKTGIIVYRDNSPVINLDEDAAPLAPMHLVRIIQKDYAAGDFEVLAAARDMIEVKEFSWDALMLEASAEEKTRR